jgi:hypothetical protein
MVENRRQPRALRLATWNIPFGASAKTIGLTGLCRGKDSLQETAGQARNLLDPLALGARNVGTPLSEYRADDVDLLTVQDLARLPRIAPGPGAALSRELGDQCVHLGAGLEQRPAQAL